MSQMEFAVNYSPVLAPLAAAKQVPLDRFKCPAWPDLLAEAQKTLPVYIHFPISIGFGNGSAVNDEKQKPVDMEWLADLLAQTGTPYINTHLVFPAAVFPEIAQDSHSAADVRVVLDSALRDLEGLIHRFGAERVLVENVINEYGWLDLCAFPEVLGQLLDESGCGFLFDLSHARIAASNFGLDAREYSSAMPLDRLRELHITGLRTLEGDLLDLVRDSGDPYGMARTMQGKKIDHLPMESDDWPELGWALGEIASGKWAEPWVVSFEYGGVGPFWEQVTSPEVYLAQLPRMNAMIKGRQDV